MYTRHPRFFLLALLPALLLFVALGMLSVTKTARAVEPHEPVIPLPGGCIGGTPFEDPVCCISGLVYFNGEPVQGAEVIIQNDDRQITVTTDRQVGSETRPYYRHTLDTFPLSVLPGEIISITASYGGSTRTITHTVQRGGQQVDIALAPNVFALSDVARGQAEAGKLTSPNGLAVDLQGNLYVADSANARIQVFDPDGRFLRAWGSSGNAPEQFFEIQKLAFDPRAEVLYVADYGNRRIAKYTTDGTLLALWDESNTVDGTFGFPAGVDVDGQGNVYVLTQSPHRIYKFNSAGEPLDVPGGFRVGADAFVYPTAIQVSPAGEVYVTDAQKNRIFKFSADGVLQPFEVDFPAAISVSPVISFPTGIDIDAHGSLYVSDLYTAGTVRLRILQVSSSGQVTKLWGEPPQMIDDTVTSNSNGLVLDEARNTIYVANGYRNHIVRIESTTGLLLPYWGGLADNAGQIVNPRGIEVGPDNAVYVADCTIGRISKLVGITVEASWNNVDFGQTDPWCPSDVAFDSQNRMLVIDPRHHRLERFSVRGAQLQWEGAWGEVGSAPGQFQQPAALAQDSNDNTYIADLANNRVQVVRIEGSNLLTITTFDGAGTQAGALTFPQGIAVDDTDPMSVAVYVADTGNNRIVKLSFSDGTLRFTKQWGQKGDYVCNESGADLDRPSGVVVDGYGNVFVADSDNARVVKFDVEGRCQGILGGHGVTPGFMVRPEGLAMDTQNVLYMSDSALGRIQRFGPIATTAPVATIVQLSATDLSMDDVLQVVGLGQVSSTTGRIVKYEWSLARYEMSERRVLTESVGSNLTIAASSLYTGAQLLELRVQDDNSNWSIPVRAQIYVAPPATSLPLCTGATWTMLLYLVGDSADGGKLEDSFNYEINKLKGVNNPCLGIAVQMDGHKSIGTNIPDTYRWLLKPGALPWRGQAPEGPELAMDASSTLTEFVKWGQSELPADHYYLAIADHGQGILGIGLDMTTGEHQFLTSAEIASALTDPALDSIDILHLDACSMALLDVFYDLRDSARYVIASQYLGWSFFAYDRYATHIALTGTPPDELAREIIGEYARLAESVPPVPYTLSVLDMSRIESVRIAVDELAVRLKAWEASDPARIDLLIDLRIGGQTFTSNADWVNTAGDEYVDLLDWAMRIKSQLGAGNPEIDAAATDLITLLQPASGLFPTAPRQGSYPLYFRDNEFIDLSRAHGLSVYFPLEKSAPSANPAEATPSAPPLFSEVYADYINERSFGFTHDTRWDEFLAQLLGVPAAGEQLAEPPPLLAPMVRQTNVRIFLPSVMR